MPPSPRRAAPPTDDESSMDDVETAPSVFDWAIDDKSSCTSEAPDLIPASGHVAQARVRMSEQEQVFVYSPAPDIVREERHRSRRHHTVVYRTRKGDIHYYEPGLSRDMFLIITLCFVAAVFLLCVIRPYVLLWMTDSIQYY